MVLEEMLTVGFAPPGGITDPGEAPPMCSESLREFQERNESTGMRRIGGGLPVLLFSLAAFLAAAPTAHSEAVGKVDAVPTHPPPPCPHRPECAFAFARCGRRGADPHTPSSQLHSQEGESRGQDSVLKTPRVTLRGVRCAQASLEAAVEAHGHVLVMFTAEWCGYALNSKL